MEKTLVSYGRVTAGKLPSPERATAFALPDDLISKRLTRFQRELNSLLRLLLAA